MRVKRWFCLFESSLDRDECVLIPLGIFMRYEVRLIIYDRPPAWRKPSLGLPIDAEVELLSYNMQVMIFFMHHWDLGLRFTIWNILTSEKNGGISFSLPTSLFSDWTDLDEIWKFEFKIAEAFKRRNQFFIREAQLAVARVFTRDTHVWKLPKK